MPAYDRDQLRVVIRSRAGDCDLHYALTTGSHPRVVAGTIAFLRNPEECGG